MRFTICGASQSHGELMDPDSMKFKDLKNLNYEKDGVMSREFFKWLGNLSKKDLKKLAKHLIMNKQNTKRLEG